MNREPRKPPPSPEGENLRRLLRARLEEDLAEARRYFGDSLDRPLVVGPQPPAGELPPGGAVADPRTRPKELLLPLLAGQALVLVEQGIEVLVAAVAEELSTCTRILVEPDLLGAVLSRPEVAKQWPWPEGPALPEREARAVLTAWHHLRRAWGSSRGGWPADFPQEAALEPVARWAKERLEGYARTLPAPQGQRIQEMVTEMIRNVESGCGLLAVGWTGPDGRRVSCLAAGMALLYRAEQDVHVAADKASILRVKVPPCQLPDSGT